MAERIIKTKERVRKYAEVFTPQRIVKRMVDLLEKQGDVLTPQATVLEPSCGEGVFLIEILARKLQRAKTPKEIIKSVATLYGVDIQQDNVEICRDNLYKQWFAAYSAVAEPSEKLCRTMRKILEHNIVCGNFLTRLKNDGKPIWFLREE